MSSSLRTTLAATSVTALLALAGSWTETSPQVEARPAQHHQDRDGDFLPDQLERFVRTDPSHSDSDRDGVGDFRAVTGDSAGGAIDHGMRTLVATTPRADGDNDVWLHLLFRFVGDEIPPISELQPYIDWRGSVKVPLTRLLDYGTAVLDFRQDGEFLLAHLAVRIGTQSELNEALWTDDFVIGTHAVIDGLSLHSAIQIDEVSTPAGDTLIALLPTESDQVSIQTLGQEDEADPFWTKNRACSMSLEVVSAVGTGVIVKVVSAECTSSPGMQCPPGCSENLGRLIYLADGVIAVGSY